ncbi:hypothetical protein DENIT_70063 [Pseudomonas veronii]|nr:hypothetical protein DENIT_70063 [Pseudomonas veronii]
MSPRGTYRRTAPIPGGGVTPGIPIPAPATTAFANILEVGFGDCLAILISLCELVPCSRQGCSGDFNHQQLSDVLSSFPLKVQIGAEMLGFEVAAYPVEIRPTSRAPGLVAEVVCADTQPSLRLLLANFRAEGGRHSCGRGLRSVSTM